MPRTPEQVAADSQLTEAIEAVSQAYDPEAVAAGLVMGEYVVIISRQGWDDHGDGITSIGYFVRDGEVPLHRTLGLLNYTGARLRQRITEDE